MSSIIWTPGALASETRGWRGTGWRLVEAQHHVSTLRLVDGIEEQAVLERLIEETKPPLPEECAGLDYLLSTPFRYGASYPVGSRFRRPGQSPGVFYCSEEIETAVAEMAFCRLLFFAESTDLPWPESPAEYTAFRVPAETPIAIDLTEEPLCRDEALWTDPADFGACQQLCDNARQCGIEIIRYRSVRNCAGRANLALLTCAAFAETEPTDRQTWHILPSPDAVEAICEFPRRAVGFPVEDFAGDPRLAPLASR